MLLHAQRAWHARIQCCGAACRRPIAWSTNVMWLWRHARKPGLYLQQRTLLRVQNCSLRGGHPKQAGIKVRPVGHKASKAGAQPWSCEAV